MRDDDWLGMFVQYARRALGGSRHLRSAEMSGRRHTLTCVMEPRCHGNGSARCLTGTAGRVAAANRRTGSKTYPGSRPPPIPSWKRAVLPRSAAADRLWPRRDEAAKRSRAAHHPRTGALAPVAIHDLYEPGRHRFFSAPAQTEHSRSTPGRSR
jgi:hypothetical protein